jgi:hypothetical protein
MPDTVSPVHPATSTQPDDDHLGQVRQMLDRLRFGSIVLTVHDGALVQIDVTEKRRFSLR